MAHCLSIYCYSLAGPLPVKTKSITSHTCCQWGAAAGVTMVYENAPLNQTEVRESNLKRILSNTNKPICCCVLSVSMVLSQYLYGSIAVRSDVCVRRLFKTAVKLVIHNTLYKEKSAILDICTVGSYRGSKGFIPSSSARNSDVYFYIAISI
jgi:hypothetical protein